MTAPSAFVLPLDRLLARDDWPREFFGPPAYFDVDGTAGDAVFEDWLDGLFGQVHFSDYRVVEATLPVPLVPQGPDPQQREPALGFHADLWVRGPLVFGLNGFYGFEFEIGGQTDVDWVRIPATVRVGEAFEIILHRVDLRVRLPRDILRLPQDRPNAFAPDPFRVEVPITGSIRIDSSFEVNFIQEAPVSFGPLDVLESGFHLTVDEAIFDLSREQQLPEIARAGLPDDFRGFFSQKVIVSLPSYLDSRPEVAALPGEETRTLEFFMENVGIGTGGLHGTIGVRQRLAQEVPVEQRPMATGNDAVALLLAEPGNGNTARGDFGTGDVAYITGKTLDGGWLLVQPTGYGVDNAQEEVADRGGPSWVDATRVTVSGNLNLVPVLPERTSDPFETGGVYTIRLGSVPLRLEQFYITFRDSVPVDFGMRASMQLQDFLIFEGDEKLEVTLSVDSKLAFSLRLSTTLPPTPLPDPTRADTFRLAGDAIIVRVDGIDFGAKRVLELGHQEPEWQWHVLLDLTVFFRWSFTKQDADAGTQRALSLKGLGVSGTGLGDVEPEFPSAAKLSLASGSSSEDAFKQGYAIKGLAFSLESIGVGVDSDGAAYISLAGSVAHFTGFKVKGTLGLRFRWRGGEFLGVAFDKAALKVDSEALEGELEVEWIDEAVPTPSGFEQRQGWRGKGRFKLKTPPRIYVYLEAAFGDEPINHAYFVVDVGSTSSGIPAGPIAFYGFTGLAGFNFVPDKLPEQRWYEDWFRDREPKMNAVAPVKWRPQDDGRVLGVGTIIGTSGDKGYRAAAKVVVVLVRPGPVVLIAGHGNILTALDELDHPERAMLAVLVVYDGTANTLTIAAQMRYQTPKDGTLAAQRFGAGSLYSTAGVLDAYFDLSRSESWYVHLGDRPPDKRLRSEFVRAFRVDGYLIVDPSLIELGVRAGWEVRKHWGPLRAELAAWIEGVVGYLYEPDQVFGAVRLGGRARLSAYGIGLGVTLGADLTAGAPAPRFWNLILILKMEMPWFLPDVNVKAEFGDRDENVPPSPLALRSVAVTNDQPVPDFPVALYPDLDPDGDGVYLEPMAQGFDEEAAVVASPLVPLDAKPAVAFGHPFNDRTGVVDNPTGVQYTEAFGDEGYFRYDLARVELWKRPRGSAAAWTLLDQRSETNASPPVDWSDYDGDLHIFGHTTLRAKLLTDASSGANLPVGLRFWAKTPFNVHLAGDEQVEGTLDADPDYPCVEIPPRPEPDCATYAESIPGQPLGRSSPVGSVVIHSPLGGRVVVVGAERAGGFYGGPPGSRLRFTLPRRARWLRVSLLGEARVLWWAGREGQVIESGASLTGEVVHHDPRGMDWLEIVDPSIQGPTVGLAAFRSGYLVREVCFEAWTNRADMDLALGAATDLGAAYPDGVDVQAETLLEPDQDYRLTLVSEVLFSEDGVEWQSRDMFTQSTYFRTAGPPGLFPSSTLLRDLGAYVHHSTPAAGAAPVYRSYDVRVAFRDDAAIRGMYARSLETLRLDVSDGSEGLLERVDGRPQILAGTWARERRIEVAGQLSLWRGVLGRSGCTVPGEPSGGDLILGSPIEPLAPDRTYRASLTLASSPTLRRDRFTPADLASMTRVDPVATGPARWAVEAGLLRQRADAQGPAIPGVTTRPGPMLLVGEPTWRNYRVTATFSAPSGTLGVVAGFVDEDNHYLAALDASAGTVEVVRVLAGVRTRLTLASPAIPAGPVQLALAYTGEWLEVTVGEERLDPVLESSIPRGRCGIFTSGAGDASFATLTVSGISLFDFTFRTSRYETFLAHVGSFAGTAAALPSPVALSDVVGDLASAIGRFPVPADASEPAQRLRDEVVASVLMTLELPDGEPAGDMDVTVVHGSDGPLGWLLESPEPLWWRDRTSLALARQELTWGGGDPRLDLDIDEATIRLHVGPGAARRPPIAAGLRDPRPPLGPIRPPVRPPANSGGLKLNGLDVDDTGGSHVELLVGAARDLSGMRIEVREGPTAYREWFRFPRDTHVAAGELLRIYEATEPDDLPPPRPGRRVFETTATSFRDLARSGTILRVVSQLGIVEEIIPIRPIQSWVDIDPGRLRLVHSADTRKALLFVAGPMGLPETLAPGAYRMTLTLRRDLGTAESTWSVRGDSAPEVATLYLTVPGAPA